MEKTDTIILSPEELAAYMAESTISVTSTYEHSPVVLMVDDTVIGTLGNFSASIGKAKSKKTFNVSAIAASALVNGTVLHYRASFPKSKQQILYIDTEQGQNHCQNVLKRIVDDTYDTHKENHLKQHCAATHIHRVVTLSCVESLHFLIHFLSVTRVVCI